MVWGLDRRVLQNISESIVAIPADEGNALIIIWLIIFHFIEFSKGKIVTNAGSHCLDLQEEREDDPPWLISQRKAEMDIIDAWISKYYVDLLQSNQTLDAHWYMYWRSSKIVIINPF